MSDLVAELLALADEECHDLQDELLRLAEDESPSRRIERQFNCGTWMFRTGDPRTGKGMWYQYECGVRTCPECRKKRIEKERANTLLATYGKEARLMTVPASADKGVSRQLNAQGVMYRRFPQADGTVKYIALDCEEGEKIDPATWTDDDWSKLVDVPAGKNISGNLHKAASPPSKNDNEARAKVKIEDVRVKHKPGADPNIVREMTQVAWEQAVLETAHLTPDLETLDMCLGTRRAAFKKHLEALGYSVTFSVYSYQWVRESEIDWRPYNDAIRKKLQKEGLYAAGDVAEYIENVIKLPATSLEECPF